MFNMRSFRSRRPSRMSVIVGTIALTLAAGGTAYAAIPNSASGVITGCYQTFLGNLRVIDAPAGQRCNPFEKQLDWNNAGVPGPKGDPGATGPAGPVGTPGSSGGIARIHEVIDFSQSPGAVDQKVASVNCPVDEVATGGGYTILGAFDKIAADVDRAQITDTGKPRGWIVFAHEVVPTDSEWVIRISAYCVPVS